MFLETFNLPTMMRFFDRFAGAPVVLLLALPVAAQQGAEGSQPWFEQPEIDLGTHLEGEIAKGRWEFTNPTGETKRLTHLQASCTCAKAVVHVGGARYVLENQPHPNSIYRVDDVEGAEVKEHVEAIPVEAGEEGSIEFHIDLRGVNGVKEATVVIQTDDEKNRVLTVKAKATATQFFLVMPPEINLNKMNWKEQRQFTARITSPIQPDFELTGIGEPLPDQMKVEYRKEMRDGAATWIVDGTYGPNVDPNAGGGVITFDTDVQNRKVQLRVMAWVQGPLEVRPGGFVPFGLIRQGEGMTKEIEFEPTDDFDLQIESVKLSNLTIDENLVQVSTSKTGKVCKLSITISPDAPRRLVRGDVRVELNHPAAKVQEIQFNGFVR